MSEPTPKQKLIEAVTERRESAINASNKYRGIPNTRYAFVISNARAIICDEFLTLIQEILA